MSPGVLMQLKPSCHLSVNAARDLLCGTKLRMAFVIQILSHDRQFDILELPGQPHIKRNVAWNMRIEKRIHVAGRDLELKMEGLGMTFDIAGRGLPTPPQYFVTVRRRGKIASGNLARPDPSIELCPCRKYSL